MNITLTIQLLQAIIDAYNRQYNPAITKEDIKQLVLSVPSIKVNNTLIDWETVMLS